MRQDPIWHRTNGADPGRDGSRVPLPWSGTEPPFGFSPAGATAPPWLPQPKEWRDLTVAAEQANPDSMLRLYCDALRIRRSAAAFGTEALTWQDAPEGVLSFDRIPDVGNDDGSADNVVSGGEAQATVRCMTNLSAQPVELPAGATLLLASGPLAGGLLPPDTTAWLRP
jgi:alpha-glucosidase